MSQTHPTDIDDRELDSILDGVWVAGHSYAKNADSGGLDELREANVKDRNVTGIAKAKLLSWKNEQVREARVDEVNRYEEALQTLSEDALFNYAEKRLAELATPNQTNEREV